MVFICSKLGKVQPFGQMDWVAVVVDEVVEGVTQGTSGGECYGTSFTCFE